jgi:predicted DNA-binding protein
LYILLLQKYNGVDMSSQIIIRVDDDLKQKVSRFALSEGKNASQVVRELMEQYVADRDMSGYIDNLWSRIGERLKTAGTKPIDINRAIKAARAKP